MTKRIFSTLLAVVTLLLALTVPAFAVDESRAFDFALSVDGKTERQAVPGDILTVTFTLRRTDAEEPYQLYAMQNEILYDSAFFELVEGSGMASGGVRTTDVALRDGYHAFYMNRTPFDAEGETWQASTVVGSFQLKVIGTAGSSVIRSSNHFVSTAGGEDRYAATAQDVTVTVTGGCLVRFESNGGSAVPEQTVALGGKVTKPEEPTKEGFYLEGWYSDIDLTSRWDFDKDTVGGNMTLYAKWTEQAPAGTFSLWWLLLLLLLLIVAALVLLGRKNAYHRGGDDRCEAAGQQRGKSGQQRKMAGQQREKKEERDE